MTNFEAVLVHGYCSEFPPAALSNVALAVQREQNITLLCMMTGASEFKSTSGIAVLTTTKHPLPVDITEIMHE